MTSCCPNFRFLIVDNLMLLLKKKKKIPYSETVLITMEERIFCTRIYGECSWPAVCHVNLKVKETCQTKWGKGVSCSCVTVSACLFITFVWVLVVASVMVREELHYGNGSNFESSLSFWTNKINSDYLLYMFDVILKASTGGSASIVTCFSDCSSLIL